MIPALIDAAVRLADLLARENAALTALDLPRAAAMLAEKQCAVAAFAAALAPDADAMLDPPQRSAVTAAAARLQLVSAENKRLLERAIAVQGRVIGVVAGAIPANRSPRYDASGNVRLAARPAAYTLATRA